MKAWQMRVAVVVLAAGLGVALAPPLDATQPLAQIRRDDWAVPELPRKSERVGEALALAGSPIFEPEARTAAAGAAPAAPPADSRWRVAGFLGRGEERRALIAFSDPARAAAVLGRGDALPTGHRIERIEPDAVCVRVGRKILRIGVETRD